MNFHALMLHNVDKYRCISRFLKRRVDELRVVDAGAGTGIVAALAVAAGARHVIAIEREPEIACLMNEWLTGLPAISAKISVIEDDVENVVNDLPPFDFAVSETIGYFGLEENVGAICEALGSKSGLRAEIAPTHITIRLVPIAGWGRPIAKTGFVLCNDPLEEWRDKYFHVKDDGPIGVCSSHASTTSVWRSKRTVVVEGVAVLISAHLDDETVIGNGAGTSWPRMLARFDSPIVIEGDCEVSINLSMNVRPFRVHVSLQACGRSATAKYATREDLTDLVDYPLEERGDLLRRLTKVFETCS